MITDLSGASRAEVYRTWCTALGRSLEPLISPIQKKTKQKTTTKTHTGVQLCFSPFVSSGSVLGTFSLPCYKSTRKACCRRSWGGRGNHAWQVLPSAAQPLTPGLTELIHWPEFGCEHTHHSSLVIRWMFLEALKNSKLSARHETALLLNKNEHQHTCWVFIFQYHFLAHPTVYKST